MKHNKLAELPNGAILLAIKNDDGTFSPLGLKPYQSLMIEAFIGKISEEDHLVVDKEVSLVISK